MADKSLLEYKNLVVSYLRGIEAKSANPENAKQIVQSSDNELLKKWLWIVSIVGVIACFVVVPFVFSFLDRYIPFLLMQILWNVLKAAMGLVFIGVCLAIYFTVKGNSED